MGLFDIQHLFSIECPIKEILISLPLPNLIGEEQDPVPIPSEFLSRFLFKIKGAPSEKWAGQTVGLVDT